jgi:outer membrane protein OmpA-like peptidoglycan-associated protein
MMKKLLSFMFIMIMPALQLHAATDHQQTLQTLDSIKTDWPELQLKAGVNNWIKKPLRLGDKLNFNILCNKQCYVWLLYIDSRGKMSLMKVQGQNQQAYLSPNIERIFPNAQDDGYEITVEPPIGLDRIYVIATDTPQLYSSGNSTEFFAEQAPEQAKQLKANIENSPEMHTAILKLENRIFGRSQMTAYTPDDIVNFFTKGNTRSIKRRKLDLHINFSAGSNVLTAQAKNNLDQVGIALNQKSMRELDFRLMGHTDSTGSDAYNRSLSMRRAQAAADHLMNHFNIDSSRLDIKGFGESQPVAENITEVGRELNRRVEIKLQ